MLLAVGAVAAARLMRAADEPWAAVPDLLKRIQARNSLVRVGFHPVGFGASALLKAEGEVNGQRLGSDALTQEQLGF